MFPVNIDSLRRFSSKYIAINAGKSRNVIRDFGIYSAVMAGCTLVGLLFRKQGFSDATIITVYILGVLISAVLVSSYISNIFVSFMAMIVFNFFFTEPLFTLHAYDAEYPVTFIVMLIVSFISCSIAARLKAIAIASDATYARTKLLFDTASRLHQTNGHDEILSTTGGQLAKLMNEPVCFYDLDKGPDTCLRFTPGQTVPQEAPTDDNSLPAVKWVSSHNAQAGNGTDMFPANPMRFLPVSIHDKVYAVAGIPAQDDSLAQEDPQREKEEEVLRRRNEKLRADLLRSISHDLRTPLTSISGNASNLLSSGDEFDESVRKQLYSDIYDDSVWLISLVENLLAVSRIGDGTMQLHRKLELMDDIVSEALLHIDRRSSEYVIQSEPSPETLLVDVDGRLIVQVLINLINNAIQYTPAGSTIRICSEREDDHVRVTVSDNGPGIPDTEKPYIFAMFYSGSKKVTDSKRSLGLGLALCRSIIRAHGCEITLSDNDPHGCCFSFTLPMKEVAVHE